MVNTTYTPPFRVKGELLFMRHPETIFNLSGRFQGQRDIPLSDVGQLQRDQAIAALTAYRPDCIHTSPLSRCSSVAEAVAHSLDIPLIHDERIIELDFGSIDGMALSEVHNRNLPLPWDNDSDWPVEGAESMEHFFARIAAAAEEFTHYEGRTVIMTHGGAMRGLIVALMGLPHESLWRFEIGNVESCIMSIDEENQVSLRCFGLTPEEIVNHCADESKR